MDMTAVGLTELSLEEGDRTDARRMGRIYIYTVLSIMVDRSSIE